MRRTLEEKELFNNSAIVAAAASGHSPGTFPSGGDGDGSALTKEEFHKLLDGADRQEVATYTRVYEGVTVDRASLIAYAATVGGAEDDHIVYLSIFVSADGGGRPAKYKMGEGDAIRITQGYTAVVHEDPKQKIGNFSIEIPSVTKVEVSWKQVPHST